MNGWHKKLSRTFSNATWWHNLPVAHVYLLLFLVATILIWTLAFHFNNLCSFCSDQFSSEHWIKNSRAWVSFHFAVHHNWYGFTICHFRCARVKEKDRGGILSRIIHLLMDIKWKSPWLATTDYRWLLTSSRPSLQLHHILSLDETQYQHVCHNSKIFSLKLSPVSSEMSPVRLSFFIWKTLTLKLWTVSLWLRIMSRH